MKRCFKNRIKLYFIIVGVILSSCFLNQYEVLGAPKIPFKTNKPIKLTILLKDKSGNPVAAKVTFWEYKPPFKVDQTFGLKWEDLDFSTVEQVYLGMVLFKTKDQFLDLHHGSIKKLMEEIYNTDRFEKEMIARNKIPIAERFNTYYSKLLIEIDGRKYLMDKDRLKGGKGPISVQTYFCIDDKIKISRQIVDNLSTDLFTPYRDMDTPQFIQWLKERQIKEEHKPSIRWILILGVIIVLILISIIIRKISRTK